MLAPVTALFLATLFAGAALYITIVEQPARLLLPDGPMLAQWQPSYARALPIQGALAIAGGVAGLASWYVDGGAAWIVGSVVLLANWPVTVLVIFPVNKRLQATRPEDADAESRRLLVQWGGLHAIRSALGLAAALIFAGAIVL